MATESIKNTSKDLATSKPTSPIGRSVSPRSEVLYATNDRYLSRLPAILSMLGSFCIGLSFYALWIIEPPTAWSSISLFAGLICSGFGILFFSLPEISVAIGDAGIGVHDGKQRLSLPWFSIKKVSYSWGRLHINAGSQNSLTFNLNANLAAGALLLREVQGRPWCKVELTEATITRLQALKPRRGMTAKISEAIVAGRSCAASNKRIIFEEAARFCPNCSQIFSAENLPATCTECQAQLAGNELGA